MAFRKSLSQGVISMTNNIINLHALLLSYIPMIAGAAGVPLIQQIVQFIKLEFFRNNKVSAYLAPLFALAVGAIINGAVAVYTGNSWVDGIVIGMLAGALASGWHELTK